MEGRLFVCGNPFYAGLVREFKLSLRKHALYFSCLKPKKHNFILTNRLTNRIIGCPSCRSGSTTTLPLALQQSEKTLPNFSSEERTVSLTLKTGGRTTSALEQQVTSSSTQVHLKCILVWQPERQTLVFPGCYQAVGLLFARIIICIYKLCPKIKKNSSNPKAAHTMSGSV